MSNELSAAVEQEHRALVGRWQAQLEAVRRQDAGVPASATGSSDRGAGQAAAGPRHRQPDGDGQLSGLWLSGDAAPQMVRAAGQRWVIEEVIERAKGEVASGSPSHGCRRSSPSSAAPLRAPQSESRCLNLSL